MIDDHTPIWAIHHHSPLAMLHCTKKTYKPMVWGLVNGHSEQMASENHTSSSSSSSAWRVTAPTCTTAQLPLCDIPMDSGLCKLYKVKWISWNCRLTFCTPVGLWPGNLSTVPSNRNRATVRDTGCACCSFRSFKLWPPNAFFLRLLCRLLDLKQFAQLGTHHQCKNNL